MFCNALQKLHEQQSLVAMGGRVHVQMRVLVRRIVVATTVAVVVGVGMPSRSSASGASASNEVSTDKGIVVGAVDDGVRSFYGIPYAAPPTGERRWASPEPALRWDAPRQATELGAACVQNINTSYGDPSVGVSEDCLFLNVQTPAKKQSKLPVMVWFHGGAYTGGQGGDYEGRTLVDEHDLIVVTVNYRLGAFGFLATTGLSEDSLNRTSGNYGIEDQQAALRWVQKNIAAFGGDPHKVTIAGQSAGGGSTCIHTVSPQSEGLFDAAIEQSGTCALRLVPTRTLEEAEAQGDTFADSLGCPSDDTEAAACLRAKTADELRDAGGGGSTGGETAVPLEPIVDGRIVPKEPQALIRAGKFNKVPLIIGSTADEANTTTLLEIQRRGSDFTADEYTVEVQELLTSYGLSNLDEVLAAYPLTEYGSPNEAVAAVRTDPDVCQVSESTKLFSKFVPTYAYEFAFRNSPPPPPGGEATFGFGAGHGLELQYLFAHQPIPLISHSAVTFSPAQQEVADAITGYWSAFMNTGNPGSGGGPTWPRYRDTTGKRVVFADDGTAITTDFETAHNCSLWISESNSS
jgi:para-nitrobenzyl esterase